jgi:hypothetical protein
MPSTQRSTSCRFSIGMLVKVRDVIATSHAGSTGTVISVRSSPHHHTLDKYLVRLSSGIDTEFWDIQLKKAQVAA